MGTYLHLPARDRALRNRAPEVELEKSTRKLADLLKAGESVSVGHNETLTPERVEEQADCQDISRDEACDQLAAMYVEQWSHYEWVNS